jgi:phage FluMu gp28-like protein
MIYTPKSLSPKDLLYPKQRQFIDDASQYKMGVTTRQWGKSTVTAGEAVYNCLVDPGSLWVCMSAGERQSLEWKAKAAEWAEAYRYVIEDVAEDRGGMSEALLKSTEVLFQNGSRIVAIPANPSTARGYSANIILDEFAYHEDPDAIWAAMFPSTTNQLAGTFMDRWRAMLKGESTEIRRHLKVRIVSTFNGRNNKFFELWENAQKNGYVQHMVTIHDAIRDGMPLDADKLKAALDDPEIWAQEFECVPLDSSSVLLPYDVIAKCESAEATMTIDPAFYSGSKKPIFIGWDFARKKDLSVPVVGEKLGDVLQTREVIEFQGMSTPDQVDAMRHRIQACERLCLDYTGPGVGCGDYLVREFGEYNPAQHKYGKIELCTFTNTLKVEIFSNLRVAFDALRLRVPINRVFREDLHSVNRVVTPTGLVTYRAPRNDDGHADRATGLALMNRAGSDSTAIWGRGRSAILI